MPCVSVPGPRRRGRSEVWETAGKTHPHSRGTGGRTRVVTVEPGRCFGRRYPRDRYQSDPVVPGSLWVGPETRVRTEGTSTSGESLMVREVSFLSAPDGIPGCSNSGSVLWYSGGVRPPWGCVGTCPVAPAPGTDVPRTPGTCPLRSPRAPSPLGRPPVSSPGPYLLSTPETRGA